MASVNKKKKTLDVESWQLGLFMVALLFLLLQLKKEKNVNKFTMSSFFSSLNPLGSGGKKRQKREEIVALTPIVGSGHFLI